MQCDTTTWYIVAGWVEWNNANLTDSEKFLAGPNGSFMSANGSGQYYGCTASGNALVRGADWANGAYSGLFATHLNDAPTTVGINIGFRCVIDRS